MKALVSILILVCLLLSGSLYYRHSKATEEKSNDVNKIQELATEVTKTKQGLDEQKQVNSTLETTLAAEREAKAKEIADTKANLEATKASLAKSEADRKAAEATAKAEMAKRDARIGELETQRDDLTKRMTDLNGSISNLETLIADTQRKLAASEGDREFLLKELKRLQSEKAELERQFNDLAMLREQVHKLRDELSVARRLDWIRRGLYGDTSKGAEKLQKGYTAPPGGKTNYDLNVELKQDGPAKIIPPDSSSPAPAPAK